MMLFAVPVTEKVARDPCQGASGTEKWIVRGTLSDELILDAIVLVSEKSANAHEARGEVHVITEGVNEVGVIASKLATGSAEGERGEGEHLSAQGTGSCGLFVWRTKELAGPEKEEEAEDSELEDVAI